MGALSEGFEERLAEVNAYLAFLTTMEEQAQLGPPRLQGAAHPISVQQQRILYASVYLQLYNLVEATMSRCIEAVAKAVVKDERWKPSDLTVEFRREWVRATARTHDDLAPDRRLSNALLVCEHLVASLPVDSSFVIDKGGGGNWDDGSIETFIKRLGFRLTVSRTTRRAVKEKFRDEFGALTVVKQFRNSLAHGSISFAECAQDMTVQRLIDLKDITVNYLREIVDCFGKWVETFEFVLPDRRPA
jgi:hypothetical protein